MNREDSAKVGGWLDHASKMARAVEQHGAEEAITALTEERDNALAALRRRSAQRDQLDARIDQLIDERDAATARAERAEAAVAAVRTLAAEWSGQGSDAWIYFNDASVEVLAALDSTTPPPSPEGEGARLAGSPNAWGCYDPQCGDSTWDHDCPVEPAALDGGQPDTPVPTRSGLRCNCPLIDVGSTYHEYRLGRNDDCPAHGPATSEEPTDAE